MPSLPPVLRPASVALALLLLAAVAPLAPAAPAPVSAPGALEAAPAPIKSRDYDHWYVVEMQGQRAGWMHSAQKTARGEITTTSAMHLEIMRGPITLAIENESEFIETTDGKPLRMRSSSSSAGNPATEAATFTPDGIEVRSTQSGVTRESRRPLPQGEWLTPAAADRFTQARVEAGDTQITVRTIDPSASLQVVSTTRRFIERTPTETLGKKVPAIRWKSSIDLYPGVVSDEFTDERGNPIRTEAAIGGIKIVTVLADKELATAKADPPELMASTLVKPNRPIDRARSIRAASYLLSLPDGDMPDLPSTGAQRTERVDARTVRVVVRTPKAGAAKGAPARRGAEDDAPPDPFLEASSMLNIEDPKIIQLVLTATAGRAMQEADGAARADALRGFVYRHIVHKTLGVGFATASEVARTQEGDCTEHGTLLAALLRADGIPSRVVSGLIYADSFAGGKQIFGYHMWTQARLGDPAGPDGGWTDLDATFPRGVPFDATHIALGTASLDDGDAANSLVTLAPLLGRLRVQVERTE